MRWTRKSIIAEIKRLHEEGERLNYAAAEKNHLNLVRASAWHFGTWRRAIEQAGIDYESLSRYQRWNKERIIARILELHKQGQNLSWRSISMEIDPSLAAAALRPNGFDGWRNAIAAAGLDPEEIARYKEWDEEKVIEEIHARKRAGLPMSSKTLQKGDQSLFCAARRRFGSWDGALDAAGLNSGKIRLRRHNPKLNAPRKKSKSAESNGESASGKATSSLQLTLTADKAADKKVTAKAAPKKAAAKADTTKKITANKTTANKTTAKKKAVAAK